MIVLDTHALVWWVAHDDRLSRQAYKAISRELEGSGGEIVVSAITAWEIAMLHQRGRLVLSMDLYTWLRTVWSIERVKAVPLSGSVAVQSTRLPGAFHKDPADRFIVALARELSVPVVTGDR